VVMKREHGHHSDDVDTTVIILTIVGVVGLLTLHLTEFVSRYLLSGVTSTVVLVTTLLLLGLSIMVQVEKVLRTELKFVLMVKRTCRWDKTKDI
jgi:hypothetical protein